ncbi:MAG: hypothetical protein EOP38_15400 [Rubrivivax sp.]|nr:MAG: hypothetical protein EOP38_15400 [Rubrivivax sp.]
MNQAFTTPAGVDELRITGTLEDDAHVTYTGAPHRVVLLLKVRPAVGMPYVVRQVGSTDQNEWMAVEAKATALKRGAQVRVYAKGLRVQSHAAGAALLAVDVTGVFPLQLATHQPSGQLDAAPQET